MGSWGEVSQSSGADVGVTFLSPNVPWALDRGRRLDWYRVMWLCILVQDAIFHTLTAKSWIILRDSSHLLEGPKMHGPSRLLLPC